jgi:hypothetical protein
MQILMNLGHVNLAKSNGMDLFVTTKRVDELTVCQWRREAQLPKLSATR